LQYGPSLDLLLICSHAESGNAPALCAGFCVIRILFFDSAGPETIF